MDHQFFEGSPERREQPVPFVRFMASHLHRGKPLLLLGDAEFGLRDVAVSLSEVALFRVHRKDVAPIRSAINSWVVAGPGSPETFC